MEDEDQSNLMHKQATKYIEFKWPPDAQPIVDENDQPVLDADGQPTFTPQPERQQTIKIWYWDINRGMKQRAVDDAIKAVIRDIGQEGLKKYGAAITIGYQSIIEKSLVGQCIKKWSLPGSPARDWDSIDIKLGDYIVNTLNIMEQFGGVSAIEAGKNLQAGSAPAPSRTSQTTTSSSSYTPAP